MYPGIGAKSRSPLWPSHHPTIARWASPSMTASKWTNWMGSRTVPKWICFFWFFTEFTPQKSHRIHTESYFTLWTWGSYQPKRCPSWSFLFNKYCFKPVLMIWMSSSSLNHPFCSQIPQGLQVQLPFLSRNRPFWIIFHLLSLRFTTMSSTCAMVKRWCTHIGRWSSVH